MKRFVLGVVSVLALAACGGGADGGSSEAEDGGDGGMQQVTFAALPILPTGALVVGQEQGFFEDEGIDLEIEMAQGGATIIPGVMSGDPQFGTSNPVSLLVARGEGLPLQVMTHWTSDREPPEKGVNGVIALKDSGIEDVADLEGKSIAINTLNSMGDLTIRQAVRAAGGDPDSLEFVELPFPDMPAALERGDVDAVWVPEPFVGSLQAGPGRLVGYTSQEAVPGMPTQYTFTSQQLVESDPELVAAMTRALETTLEYADQNPDEVKAAASELMGIPAEALENAELEAYGTDLRLDQLGQIGDLMVEEGWIDEAPDLDALVVQQ